MMRKISLLFWSTIATLVVASNAWAQGARVVDLGQTSDLNAVWYDSSNDLAWVGGSVISGVETPTMWSIDETDNVTQTALTSLQSGGRGFVQSIAPDGSRVSGSTVSGLSSPEFEGTIWNFGQWSAPSGVGSLSGVFQSDARAIASNGRVVGTSNNTSFYKDMSGVPSQLAALPGAGLPNVVADGTSADGSVFVGNGFNSAFATVAVQWTNDGQTATPLEDPDSIFSYADKVSPDGTNVAGAVTTLSGAFAAVWIEGSLQFPLDDQGFRVPGVFTSATDDGFFVGGGVLNAQPEAIVWHETWPNVKSLENWLIENGESTPPALENGFSVYHDGESYHIIADGPTNSYYVQTDDVGGGTGGPTFDLAVNPNPVNGGQVAQFNLTDGTPNAPVILLLTKRNGNPVNFFGIAGIGFADANGDRTFNRWMPWWWAGDTNTYQGVTVDAGFTQLIFTDEVDVVIQ